MLERTRYALGRLPCVFPFAGKLEFLPPNIDPLGSCGDFKASIGRGRATGAHECLEEAMQVPTLLAGDFNAEIEDHPLQAAFAMGGLTR